MKQTTMERPPTQPRKILFLHIPKTAGTSFTRALDRLTGPRLTFGQWTQLRDAVDEDLARYNLITGHFYAYQIERPLFAPYLKVTVLRDPLDRFISAYHFAKQAASRGRGDDAQQFASQVTPFEFFMSPPGASSRHAQLFLLGLNHDDDARNVPLETLRERAERRLATMVVAVVPRLDALTAHLQALFGIDADEAMPAANVTPETFRTDHATADELAMMRRMLAVDYALYDAARERCEAFLADPRLPGVATAEPVPAATWVETAKLARLSDA